MSERPNIPVPDELAAVREQIRQLEQREQTLRGIIMDNPDTRTGARYVAEVVVTKQQRTDWRELRHFHPTIVDEFTMPVEITRIVLSGITEDGELVSPRKLKAT